jgi:multiple sugar transport system substrate-binding protein
VNIPDDGEFDKKIAALFAAGIPPDVFTINYRRFGQFAIKGALQPVEQYLANSRIVKAGDYYPAALDAFKFKGRQYCIPQNLSSLEVYYNKSLFEAAQLPLPKAGWTWDEFLKDAKALTKDTNGDGRIDQYGLGVQPSTIRLVAFVWAHGGEIVDNPDTPTRLTIDSGPALEAFQWFVNLQVKEHVVPSKADEATEGDLSRFEHGTLGMYLNSRVQTPELRATIGNRFQWDVAPMPVGKNTATVLHSDGYCISSDSTNKDLAWAFTEFATGPDGQKQIVLTGRTVPSLQAVAQSPAFLVSAEPPAGSQIYLDMAPYIRRVPIMTTWLEVEDVLNQEIKRAFYGDATVEEAAQSAVNSTLEYFKLNLKDLGTP